MPKPEEAIFVVGKETSSWKKKFDEIIEIKNKKMPDMLCNYWQDCFPITFMAPCCGYHEILEFSDMPKFGKNRTCNCGKTYLIYFEK